MIFIGIYHIYPIKFIMQQKQNSEIPNDHLRPGHRDSRYLLLGGLFAIGLIGLFVMLSDSPESVTPVQGGDIAMEQTETIPDGYVRRITDGVYIPEEVQVEEIYAVMIENSADAWPLSGLHEARLVIEAPVEGSIPRFMAVFDNTMDNDFEIGPVRSARPYYVEWAKGLNTLYAHVGGSPQGLDLIQSIALPDLNQFFWGQYFWRSTNRYAPHNVFTNIEELHGGYTERAYDLEEKPLFAYVDQEDADKGDIRFIEIPFSTSSHYDAGWEYDPEVSNAFFRYQGGEPKFDSDGTTNFAQNVIVLFTDISVIDEVGRLSLRTLGEGEGKAYKDGKEYSITWTKEKRQSAMQFFDGDEEYLLNPGRTWIEVLPLSTEIEVTTSESGD